MSNYSKVTKQFSEVRVSGTCSVAGKLVQTSVISATESLVAAATLDSTDSGKILFLNLVGGFTVTLPAVEAGASLKFIVATAPTTDYIIDAGSAIVHGNATSGEITAVAASTQGTPVATIHLVASLAQIGDSVELVSDGTSWFANVVVAQQDAATFA
jgi:hypothetical protein